MEGYNKKIMLKKIPIKGGKATPNLVQLGFQLMQHEFTLVQLEFKISAN